MNRLSHSAVQKYMQCGEAYRLHYREGYRERNTSAALLFGTAIDEALNALLETKDPTDALDSFHKHWRTGLINNVPISLPEALNVVYAAADFDGEILSQVDQDLWITRFVELYPEKPHGTMLEEYKVLQDWKKQVGKENMTESEIRLLSYGSWLCLAKKGALILDAYNLHILPRIKRVLSVQEKLEIKSTDGDSIVMVVDMVCEWEDGSIIVFDHKTAAQPYDSDSVKTKPQLALYAYKLQERYKDLKAGYIIFLKNISKNKVKTCGTCKYVAPEGSRHKSCSNEVDGKRCGAVWIEVINPEASIQLLIDTVPERLQNMVMENFDTVNVAIQNNVFPKNLASCGNVFGQRCPFFNKCHNGDDSNLDKQEQRR